MNPIDWWAWRYPRIGAYMEDRFVEALAGLPAHIADDLLPCYVTSSVSERTQLLTAALGMGWWLGYGRPSA
jgi:hypothetical protein